MDTYTDDESIWFLIVLSSFNSEKGRTTPQLLLTELVTIQTPGLSSGPITKNIHKIPATYNEIMYHTNFDVCSDNEVNSLLFYIETHHMNGQYIKLGRL